MRTSRALPERPASPHRQRRHASPFAITSLICGIYSIAVWVAMIAARTILPPTVTAITATNIVAQDGSGVVEILAIPSAIAAIIVGTLALEKLRATGEKGSGLAITGIILGALALAAVVILVVAITLTVWHFVQAG